MQQRTIKTTVTLFYVLFYDTVKGGDYRAREANVYHLAEVSNDIIDQVCCSGCTLSHVNMVVCLQTVLSVVHRLAVHSMQRARLVSSFFSVLILL